MTMTIPQSHILGVEWRAASAHGDERGWLCELFRADELPAGLRPQMAYISETKPGVTRGPHEHERQTDVFVFLGAYQVDLWDNRPTSTTFQRHETVVIDANERMQLIVPPGIVHCYKNIGVKASLVVNCPDRLYKGPGRLEMVDEIRHEDDPQSPFKPS